MSQTLEALSHHQTTLTSIRGIVHTMKTLSAINAVPYEHAADAIDAYHQTVLEGFRAFLLCNGTPPSRPVTTTRQVVVVFGSDHGLCGGYNETLASKVKDHLDTRRPQQTAIVICVGARMKDALLAHGVKPETTLLPPASIDGIGRLSGRVAARIDEISGQHDQVELSVALAFTERSSNGSQAPVVKDLLPLDLDLMAGLAGQEWVSRSLPGFSLPATVLLADLIAEHLFAALFRASTEALVTENAARLALMQQAEKSIDDRLEALKSETRTVRQSQITTELLDIFTGFEALRLQQKEPPAHRDMNSLKR